MQFSRHLKKGCRRENTQGGDPVRDRGARPDVKRLFTHKAITAAVLRSRSPEGAGKDRRERPRPYKHTRTKSDAENQRSYTAPAEKNQSQNENHNNGGKTVLNRFKPPRACFSSGAIDKGPNILPRCRFCESITVAVLYPPEEIREGTLKSIQDQQRETDAQRRACFRELRRTPPTWGGY